MKKHNFKIFNVSFTVTKEDTVQLTANSREEAEAEIIGQFFGSKVEINKVEEEN